MNDLLPSRLHSAVSLLTRAADEALRALAEGFSIDGSRPRLVDGAVPVVLAAALRCATHLDRFAAVSDAGLEPKPVELAADSASAPALKSIVEVRHDHLTDPHAVQIHASPDSAFAYQDVLAWMRGLQARFDECWAVIGDVYGDRHFGLKLRTASTPLAYPMRARLNKALSYVPELVRLTTASAELIRLLTAPLYGDKPEVGVRELLQNALDAVRERAHWPSPAVGTDDPRLVEWQCDVLIRLLPPAKDEDGGWLEIVDRGVGMTPETVRDYYLRVGASLRQDADWMQRFPVSKQTELLRSGRFGIGTLASYLLGDEVHVTTRHVTETDGIGTSFVARLSDSLIELRRVPASIGTSIRIPIRAAVHEALASSPKTWGWFALKEPRVVRLIGDAAIDSAVAESNHDLGRMPWRQVPFEGLERVLWRSGREARQRLWCNGLLIENAHETIYNRRYKGGGPWILDTADVMVFDGRGRLPMAVTRDHLEGRAPYHDALLHDFLLDHCAWLLARAELPPAIAVPQAPLWRHYDPMSPGDGTLTAPPYMEVEGGLLPWATMCIAASGTDTVIAFDGHPSPALEALQPGRAFALVPMEIFGGFSPESRTSVATRHLRDFVRAIVPATSVDVLTQFGDDATKAFGIVGAADGITWRSNDTRVDAVVVAPLLPIASALARRYDANVVAFATVDPSPKPRLDAFAEIWNELGLPAVIPRDATERERTCGQALAVLGNRVRNHLDIMQA